MQTALVSFIERKYVGWLIAQVWYCPLCGAVWSDWCAVDPKGCCAPFRPAFLSARVCMTWFENGEQVTSYPNTNPRSPGSAIGPGGLERPRIGPWED